MAFEDANEKAFEGGDTEPETAKIIHQRNQALQTLSDKVQESQQKAAEAQQEAYDAAKEAEAATAEEDYDLITGAPVITAPEQPAAAAS
jgi:hypothetical protein